MPASSRFSDNPFRDPNLTPEQVERIEKRNEALRIYRETGDEGPAIEVGLFPSKPMTRMTFKGVAFMLHRPELDGPTVDVSIACVTHQHEPYTISLFENTNRWAYGRKAEGGKTHHGNFKTAVRRCADLLTKECTALTEVDEFFGQATIFCVLEGDEPNSFDNIDFDAILKEDAKAKSKAKNSSKAEEKTEST